MKMGASLRRPRTAECCLGQPRLLPPDTHYQAAFTAPLNVDSIKVFTSGD